jgi:hypothetical protein
VIISIPVWGQWYRDLFQTVSFPSYRDQLGPDDRLIIHGEPFDGIEAEYRDAPARGDSHHRMGECHKDALRIANGGPIAFIPPDCMVSAGALDEIRYRLETNDLIAAACIRVAETAPRPPPTSPRGLMRWALDYRHRIMRVSTYGESSAASWPSMTLFDAPCGAIVRAFHLHPLAVQNAPADFSNTIDDGLVSRFPLDRVHVVTDSDDLAFAEISPDSRTMGECNDPCHPTHLANFAKGYANPMHRHFFNQRIVLRARDGSDECGDREIVDQVNARI